MDCTMKPALTDDQLDALLATQPVVAKSDFTRITLQRLDAVDTDQELDWLLDDHLAAMPVQPSADFTQKTLHAALSAEGQSRWFPGAPLLRLASLAAVVTLIAWVALRPDSGSSTVDAPQQVVAAPHHQPMAAPVSSPTLFDTTSLRLISIMHDLDLSAEGAWDSHPLETLALLTLQ